MAGIAVDRPGRRPATRSAVPGTTFAYDFRAFVDRQQPVSVRSTRRVHHANDPEAPADGARRDDRDGRVLRRLRAPAPDAGPGRGRPLRRRTHSGDAGLPADQVDAGPARRSASSAAGEPRVVVSGWQIYDNKGRVVETVRAVLRRRLGLRACPSRRRWRGSEGDHVLRPARPGGPHRQPRRVRAAGGPRRARHDRRRRTWRTRRASSQRPGRSSPTTPTTTPAAPTAPPPPATRRTGTRRSASRSTPWAAPFERVERNGPDPAADWYVTRSTYDIRGNLLVGHRRARPAGGRHVYDLANRPCARTARRGHAAEVCDAAGNAIEERDGKGALVLHAYDALGRPSRSGPATAPATRYPARALRLRRRRRSTGHAARAANRLGRLCAALRRGRPADGRALRLQGQRARKGPPGDP